jgi:hypothetical protein
MKDNKLTFKEYVVKQCQSSIMWLPVLQKMAGSSYGVQCINLFKHDYCRFICQVPHPLLLAERKKSPEGQ